ncbi:uncharacterized protein LOC111915235 [Lactuca sativa]|uniref:uncharacterized protein LOC111915235 n=1 Tax=Lactuca sativa TaxID=4236 RepID=UPI0022AFBA9D|nr:uncharacterized protein LOC111915235 [Lactuca sativa]
MDDLVDELSSLLNKNGDTECLKGSMISKAQIHKGVYSKNMLLLGESEAHMKESCSYLIENGALLFWTNLLKETPWENSCSRLSRRVQKSFRHEPENESDLENFQINTTITPPSVRTRVRSKRRVCTQVEQSTSSAAECTNNQPQPQQPQNPPVVPSVSDQSCNDAPLETELENIKKEREKIKKLHEEKKSMLISECEKEILEVRKKYDGLIDESEMCLTKKMNVLEQYYDLVYANKVLADTLTRTCDDTFDEENCDKEIGVMRVLEIPASTLIQSVNRCTSTTSIPTLRAPAPHLRSSSSLFPSLPTLSTPQTQTELNNVDYQVNTEKLPVFQSSNLWPELLVEFDTFYDMGFPSLPFLDSN